MYKKTLIILTVAGSAIIGASEVALAIGENQACRNACIESMKPCYERLGFPGGDSTAIPEAQQTPEQLTGTNRCWLDAVGDGTVWQMSNGTQGGGYNANSCTNKCPQDGPY